MAVDLVGEDSAAVDLVGEDSEVDSGVADEAAVEVLVVVGRVAAVAEGVSSSSRRCLSRYRIEERRDVSSNTHLKRTPPRSTCLRYRP